MPQNSTSRNIVILCDGTWNREDSSTPTNIAKLYSDLLVHKKLHQDAHAHAATRFAWQKVLHETADSIQMTHPLFIQHLLSYLKDEGPLAESIKSSNPLLMNTLSDLKNLLSAHALYLSKPYLNNTDHLSTRIHQIIEQFPYHQDDLQASLLALHERQERWGSWLWKKTQDLALALWSAPKSLYNWISHFYSDHSQEEYTATLINLFNPSSSKSHSIQRPLELFLAMITLNTIYKQCSNPREALAMLEHQKQTASEHLSSANQVIYYDRGVGTWGMISRYLTGATGRGLELNIKQAYTFLCQNYQPGDKIFYFGFSRGAFTVRSLLNMVHRIGLLPKELTHRRHIQMAFNLYQNGSEEEIDTFKRACAAQNPTSEFIGVFDTVGAMGLIEADTYNQWRHGYHDMRLQGVRVARHAIALDEHREDFAHVPMQTAQNSEIDLEERVFAGAHSDVGGGYSRDKNNQQLSDLAATWMYRAAAQSGLSLPDGYFPSGLLPDNKFIIFGSAHAKRHDSRYTVAGTGLRSSFIRPLTTHQTIDPSVVDRMRASPSQQAIQEENYDPRQLRDKTLIEIPISEAEAPFRGTVSHYSLFRTKAEQAPLPQATQNPRPN